MNTHAHTPGPWHRNIRAQGRYPVVFAGRNTHIAIVQQQSNANETEANIDLIAAAPDLLQAMQKLIGAIDRLPGNNPLDGLADEARAVIARATGE